MLLRVRWVVGLCVVALAIVEASSPPQTPPIRLFLIERPVGVERSTLQVTPDNRTLVSSVELTDRGTTLRLESTLTMAADGTPRRFTSQGRSYRFVNVDVDVTAPAGAEPWFPARTWAPVATRAALIAYWEAQGRPGAIRLVPGDVDSRIVVSERGRDVVMTAGRRVTLRRFSVDGVIWGRETVWIDEAGGFAALVSRVHILPLEAVRDDLVDALPILQARAIEDRMEDLEDWMGSLPPRSEGTFALEGARIIVDPDTAPIDDGMVVIRDGRIHSVGPRSELGVPSGTQVIRAEGRTIIAGLWDMHAHTSQIEWGPAYLAAGVTSVRDMGGEAAFLTAFRDSVASGRGLGPALELAGLVDGPGDRGFGTVIASTPAEGRAIVDRYVDTGFRQIKLYSLLQPPVVSAITARAHERGVTVTGHVPSALTPDEAVRAGMDQIAHLPGALTTALAVERHTVIDPTQAWGELLGRPSDVPAEQMEPCMTRTPYPLAENYRSVVNAPRGAAPAGAPRGGERVRDLVAAGVTVVAGTDGAVPGCSLIRELELYAAAGVPLREVLRTATTAAAAAVGRQDEVGRIAPGYRADLVVVDGDPLTDIGALRRVTWVVSQGRMWSAGPLWRIAGFRD